MKKVAENIPAYDYGKESVGVSPASMTDLENLKQSVQFTEEDERYLRLAGEVLADQTTRIVNH